jgi:hypothetical protein
MSIFVRPSMFVRPNARGGSIGGVRGLKLHQAPLGNRQARAAAPFTAAGRAGDQDIRL